MKEYPKITEIDILELDIFQFRVIIPSSSKRNKRAILSIIAKFFDPLG